MFTIFALRKKKYPPIIDLRNNEVIDDGEPKQITLWKYNDEKAVKRFASNVRNNVKTWEWKIWIEET